MYTIIIPHFINEEIEVKKSTFSSITKIRSMQRSQDSNPCWLGFKMNSRNQFNVFYELGRGGWVFEMRVKRKKMTSFGFRV